YISGRDLAKQEGLIFRHILRLILLLGEFSQVVPPGLDPEEWRTDLRTLADRLTDCCKAVDPQSTEYMLAHAADVDVLAQEPQRPNPVEPTRASPTTESSPTTENSADDFGGDILDSE
ncbi:MAG: helicase, partial [Planctomycetaceae bacterium]|nr:helicase [Planctomycetaceae bacterium]